MQPVASAAVAGTPRSVALLLLGHRARLMFETVPSQVIAPIVASGSTLSFFALLENATMARAFRGRRPLGNPRFATMSDRELSQALKQEVEAAGGHVARIEIGARPSARLPEPGLASSRLSRYTEAVKRTVATRFLKEKLGLRFVAEHEAATSSRFGWVLWTREDSHWFAPFQIRRFQVGAVHGKSCGGFGGWNDKVWLIDREWAEPMLRMYDVFHARVRASCVDLIELTGRSEAYGNRASAHVFGHDPSYGGAGHGLNQSSVASELVDPSLSAGRLGSDFLAAPSVEQFRERVGQLSALGMDAVVARHREARQLAQTEPAPR